MRLRTLLATVVLALSGTLVVAAPANAGEAAIGVHPSNGSQIAGGTSGSPIEVVLTIDASGGAHSVSTTRTEPCAEETGRADRNEDCVVTYTAGVGGARPMTAADATALGIELSDFGVQAALQDLVAGEDGSDSRSSTRQLVRETHWEVLLHRHDRVA
jgi:hypothetical protein